MKNSTIESINTNEEFAKFIDTKFDRSVKKFTFPEGYNSQRTSQSVLDTLDFAEVKDIQKRERIRDNIYIEYKFDIFEYPLVVYYENSSENLKPFKKVDEAQKYCRSLQNRDVKSLLIMIMNNEIECRIYE